MVISLALTVVALGAAQTGTEWFRHPPAERRILKIVHMLPDDPAERDALIRDLQAKGFGGMATNVSFKEYLQSEAKWQSFVDAVQKAKAAGMALWLYDEKGYPSGNAGGQTLEGHPEWEARGLLYAVQDAGEGLVSMEVPPGRLVRALALPLEGDAPALDKAVDLSSSVTDGKLAWQAPAGNWRIMAITEDRLFDGTHMTASFGDHIPYVNLMMREPTERFLELTHAAYAKRLGDDLGKYFTATFTDEPSLMSLYMKPQPWLPVPWSPDFAHVFRDRRGYDLEPSLPLLATGDDAKAQSVRYDFWLTVGELTADNFFGAIQEWCRSHNTQSGGHLLYEEPLLMHVPLYGDFFRCARRLDAPSIDCLTSVPEEVPSHIARLISSAAELEGRRVTMCETSDFSQRYRGEGDTRPVRAVTEEEIRGTCNRLIMNGITTITSYYSFADLGVDQLVRLNEWVGRCAATLEGGHQVADVALVYPTESVWVHLKPSRLWTQDAGEEAQAIEDTYRRALDDLYGARRDFTFVDSRAIAESEAADGALRHGKLAWRVLMLPRVDTLPLAAWENIARFWESGGAVIALGALPANSEKEFPSARVTEIARRVFGTEPGTPCVNDRGGAGIFLTEGMEGLLPMVLDGLIEPDVRVSDNAPIRATHRSIGGQETYFIINDGREPWEGHISLSAEDAGEMLNPATGEVAPCASAQDVALRLEPFSGMLYRFAKAAPPKRLQPAKMLLAPVEGLPKLNDPFAGKGEFVDAGIEKVATDAGNVWRTRGGITKNDVDTFLFACFDYAEPADLSQGDCVQVAACAVSPVAAEVAVHVILVDGDGREFMTRLGELDPRERNSYTLPLSRFERAGWKPDPAGPFNFASVKSIRVGWGGYHGTAGEEVVLEIGEPRIVRTVNGNAQ